MTPTMTVDQFMMYLELTPRDWELVGPYLRTRAHKDCPVTAVCRLLTGTVYSAIRFTKAAEALGLDRTKAGYIAGSADRFFPFDDYRMRLLLACGLGESGEVPCELLSTSYALTSCE